MLMDHIYLNRWYPDQLMVGTLVDTASDNQESKTRIAARRLGDPLHTVRSTPLFSLVT